MFLNKIITFILQQLANSQDKISFLKLVSGKKTVFSQKIKNYV